MEELIRLTKIDKSFGKKKVLQQISLTIRSHECIALLGHNGCGKSTLLKIIAGVSSISQGMIQYQKNICLQYIPERLPQLAISAQQYLLHMAKIEGLQETTAKEHIYTYSKAFFMEDLLHTPMRYLSKGTLQKVGVIQALLKPCDVVLMDEPLNGQDTESQMVFLAIMKQLKRQGTAIILACHEPYLVNELADQCYRIEQGYLRSEVLTTSSAHIKHMVFAPCDISLDSSLQNMLISCSYKPTGVHICTTPSSSNEVILQLLSKGWELEEMYNEDIMES